jgi:hypothetical protein
MELLGRKEAEMMKAWYAALVSWLVFATMAVPTSAGLGPDTLWTCTYGDSSQDVGCSIVATADGGYAVAGYSIPDGSDFAQASLLRLSPDGGVLWRRLYGHPPCHNSATCLGQTSDGGFVLAGGYCGNYPYVVRTDGSGDTLWTRWYYPTLYLESSTSITETSDGHFIMTCI